MAHLWIRDQLEDWAVVPLAAEAFSLGSTLPRPLSPAWFGW